MLLMYYYVTKKRKYNLLSTIKKKKRYVQANCRLVIAVPYYEAIHIIWIFFVFLSLFNRHKNA